MGIYENEITLVTDKMKITCKLRYLLIILSVTIITSGFEGEGCNHCQLDEPICASNKKTYFSECEMMCANKETVDLKIIHHGACKRKKKKNKFNNSPFLLSIPSNGGYATEKRHKKRKHRKAAKRKHCPECVTLLRKKCRHCVEEKLFCGTDTHTYTSLCQMRCLNPDKEPKVQYWYSGKCYAHYESPPTTRYVGHFQPFMVSTEKMMIHEDYYPG